MLGPLTLATVMQKKGPISSVYASPAPLPIAESTPPLTHRSSSPQPSYPPLHHANFNIQIIFRHSHHRIWNSTPLTRQHSPNLTPSLLRLPTFLPTLTLAVPHLLTHPHLYEAMTFLYPLKLIVLSFPCTLNPTPFPETYTINFATLSFPKHPHARSPCLPLHPYS